MTKRYMKNTETGVVMPMELPLLNKMQNLVECDEKGNVLGKANIESSDLLTRNAVLEERITDLQGVIKDKELAIARLSAEIDLLKQQGGGDRKEKRVEELSLLKKAELVVIAEKLSVPTAGKKVPELIELIVDAEFEPLGGGAE